MSSSWSSSRMGRPAQVFPLSRDATVALPRNRNGIVVRAERGSVVVTQAGDPDDHVLGAGEEVRLPPGGLAVAWALRPSVISVREAGRRDDAALAA